MLYVTVKNNYTSYIDHYVGSESVFTIHKTQHTPSVSNRPTTKSFLKNYMIC